MSTTEPSTSQGWISVLHDLTAREQHLKGVIDDASETIRRHALARSRSEPTAVSISSEAETAKAAAQRDLEALAPAISEANARRAACQASEREADRAQRDAEIAERAKQLIATDMALLEAMTTLCEIIEKRHGQFCELVTLTGKSHKIGMVIGGGDVESVIADALAAVPGVGRLGGALQLRRNDRASFCFVQRDCDLFNVEIPEVIQALDVDDVYSRHMKRLVS